MSVNNLFPTILIFLYLLIIFILGFYKKIRINNIKNKLDNENNDIILSFYCYNNSTIRNLFYLTFLNLIDKKYYKLYKKDDINYIKWNKLDILNYKDNTLKNYEIRVIRYINYLIYKDSENDYIELNQLEYLIKTDFLFNINLNNFYEDIKNDAKCLFGLPDKISDYVFSMIFGILYFVQVLFFINNKFNLSDLIIISIPMTLGTIIISDKLKNKIIKFNFKKIIFSIIISLITGLLACILWINMSNFNYIIFHIIMALISFMYPLFIIINVYFIKSNTCFLNQKQKVIVEQLNNFLDELLSDPKKAKKYFVYSRAFKIKTKSDNDIINEFIHMFSI